MPNAIWKGSISFGLVTIPVALHGAESKRDLSFHMLDRRDLSPVRNKRVNATTGAEVPWEEIVKGYEIEEGRWVVLTDDDFRAANVEATQTIDVLGAVCADEIGIEYFAKPYYLQPEKAGRKAYALLRETLSRAGRVAVARIVIRTREHLALIAPHGRALVLEIVRYPYELRDTSALDLPAEDLAESGVTEAEIAMATQLVDTIATEWQPERYRDTYRDDLLALIELKAAGGEVLAPPPPPEVSDAEVIDIATLLKASIEQAAAGRA